LIIKMWSLKLEPQLIRVHLQTSTSLWVKMTLYHHQHIFQVASLFSKPTFDSQEVQTQLSSILQKIVHNLKLVDEWSTLEAQRKFFGPLLKHPFPIATSFTSGLLMTVEPLHFPSKFPGAPPTTSHWDIPTFEGFVQSLASGDMGQTKKLGAVYNVSGAGKSKLCLNYCVEHQGMFIHCFDESRCLHHLVRVLTAFQYRAEQQDPEHQNCSYGFTANWSFLWLYRMLRFY